MSWLLRLWSVGAFPWRGGVWFVRGVPPSPVPPCGTRGTAGSIVDGVGVDAHIGGRDDIIARCRSTDLPARWRHVHLMGIDFVFVSSEQRLLTVL